MYRYRDTDQRLIEARAAEFRDQVERRLRGELAEADFKAKKQELIDEMEKLKTVIKILKKADKGDDVELPWLLGKLEEEMHISMQ